MAHIEVMGPGIGVTRGVWKMREPVRPRDAVRVASGAPTLQGISLDAGMLVDSPSPDERVRKALIACHGHFSRPSTTGASSPVSAKRVLHGLGNRKRKLKDADT